MMIIDGSIKIQRVNTAFLDLFELSTTPENGSRLSDLEHDFWKRENLKPEIRAMLIENKPLKIWTYNFLQTPEKKKPFALILKLLNARVEKGGRYL